MASAQAGLTIWVSLALLTLAIGVWYRALAGRAALVSATAGLVFGLLLVVAYLVIDQLTGSGIDASVLYHLQVGLDGAGTGAFGGLAAFGVLGVLGSGVAAWIGYRLVRSTAATHRVRAAGGAAVLLAAGAINPATGDLIRLAGRLSVAEAAPSGPPPPGFVPVETVEMPGPRRNFVFVYLESVERSYFDEARFPGLMPNLRALEGEAVSFTDLTEVEEAGWTIAGMVASQCGMPLIGSGAGVDQFLPAASCLGDLLHAQGYDLSYIGGADMGFAGKGTFYDSHSFDRVEGRTELEPLLADPAYVNEWGLFDDSLYPEVVKRFDALAAEETPFGLVMLTLDTHHPFGFPSQSCADAPYGDGTNQFLNAVHCADRLAADFIRHVRQSPAFANTVLVVASDHMAMPNLAEQQLDAGPRRNLLMIFAPDLAPRLIDKPGTTLDTGPTILSLIGAPTPALGFGRDLLAGAPTLREGEVPLEDLISDGRSYLAAMWAFPTVRDGLTLDPVAGEVALEGRRLKYPVLLRLDPNLSVTGMDFDLSSDVTLAEIVATLPLEQAFLWIDSCDRTAIFAAERLDLEGGLCALAGSLGSPDLQQIPLEGVASLSPETISAAFQGTIEKLAFRDSLMEDLTRRRQFAAASVVSYTPPNGLTGRVDVRSAGYLNGESWAMNPETGEKVGLMRGLTLLGLTPGETPVKLGHVDTCGYGGRQPDPEVPPVTNFQAMIDANSAAYGAFVIAAHNSVVCYEVDPGLEPLFAGSALSKWQDLWYEEPYVAVIAGNGEVQEFTGERQTALGVELTNLIRPTQRDGQRQLDWLPRIAHAGGALGAQTYTSSLEALAENGGAYELIEIDLSFTSDDQLVCLHDWDAPFLAFDGEAPTDPLPLAEVMDRAELQAGFTPCTLETLVDWMRGHSGARIVLDLKTDALAAYARIAEAYPDLRNRFVPQIYQPEDYGAVRDMGYPDVIWSLYQYSGSTDDVLAALKGMDLLGLAMPPERLQEGLAAKAREATGVLSWVHTINTQAELDAALAAGAAEVFTDDLRPVPVLRFDAVSAGYDSGESLLRDPEGKAITLPRGISLLAIAPGAPRVIASFDGCAELDTGNPPDPAPFHTALTAALKSGRTLAVIVHDSAFCEEVPLAPVFAGTPLTKAADIGFRAPYIGLVRPDGRVAEFTGAEGTKLHQTLTVEVAP